MMSLALNRRIKQDEGQTMSFLNRRCLNIAKGR